MTDAFADINPRPLAEAPGPFPAGSARQPLFDDFLLHMADRNHWDQIAWNVRFSNGPVEKSTARSWSATLPASSRWPGFR